MILKLSRKVHFFKFVLTSAKKSKYAIPVTYMHLKGLVTYFQEMLLFIMLWLNVLKIVWNWRILLNFCWVCIAFDTLIANISWMEVQTPINHIIIWKTVTRTSRSTYVNFFNRFRFLAGVSTKLQTTHFSGQFKDHNSGRKHGN